MASHTSMFAGATIGAISNSTFNIQKHSETSALEKLSAVIAHSALYDAPARTDETRCHPHTRIHVLDRLERWAQGLCDEGAPIFWLHGGAGAGKSAVMQTLAERCVAQRLALGCFFFSRTDKTRNTVEVLIPTIVYQLVQIFPSALEVLDPVINRDPMIFKKSLRIQLLDLLVLPLRHLVQRGSISDAPCSPRIFLIDGLDECNDPSQQQAIIRAVAEVCHDHHIPVKFLIASRPEDEISTSFRCYRQENRELGAMSLSEDPKAEADIRQFLKDQFLKIRSQHSFHKMIPSDWPDFYDINRLVWKSSYHFIYASTAMKYIWSAKENPVRSLQVVLGLQASRTISPFVELDALHHHILGSAAHLDKVLQILGHCICGGSPSITVVCVMLDCSEDDLTIYLADVSPLVVLFQSWRNEKEVKLLHASLGDFLCTRPRAGTLYVNKQIHLASQLECCFRVLNVNCRLPTPSSELRSSLLLPVLGQVLRTISTTSHLAATQQALKQCSLLTYYEWRLHFKNSYVPMSGVIFDFLKFFLAVRSIKTSSGALLYRGSADDFLDILQTHSSMEGRLVAPMFTLIFSGYSVRAFGETLLRFVGAGPPGPGEGPRSEEAIWAIFDRADISSIRQSISTLSKRLAVAAEAILKFVFGDRDASTNHARQSTNAYYNINFQANIAVADFLDALLWALPKADISENIALYLQRVPILDGSQQHAIRMSLVRKCLEDYNNRLREHVLEQLNQRIEIGDVNALIEKSHILGLNLQD